MTRSCGVPDERIIWEVVRCARQFFGAAIEVDGVRDLVTAAYRAEDLNYNVDVAAKWGAEHFPEGIPAAKVAEHAERLRACGGDFTKMAQQQLKSISKDRLNDMRIDSLDPRNPERSHLRDLAKGMHVPLEPGFVPNGGSEETRPKLRNVYKKAHAAVDAKLYDLVEADLAIVLPMELAAGIDGSHFSPAHWTPKQGKEFGRPIVDSTDISATTPVLNGPHVAEEARQRWGEIENPTINEIVVMLLEFKDEHPDRQWTEVEMWKMDLKGAFTLMSFKAENCKLFAVELMGGIALIFLCGLFGWTATPTAFQVITRAILYEVQAVHRIRAKMYVDDVIAVSMRERGEEDRAKVGKTCRALLGDNAVADDKTEHTTPTQHRLDVIGYTVALDTQLVTLTRRNFLRTLYAFFAVDLATGRVTVRAMERLASLASRYGAICQVMRPFARSLYHAIKGKARNVTITMGPATRRTVRLWRAMLCSAALEEDSFARPLESFRMHRARFTLQFDASLSGIGIKVLQRDLTGGPERTVGGGAVSIEEYGFGGESKFQNTAEFIGGLVALVATVKWCVRNGAPLESVVFRGDSVTALTWTATQRYRGEAVGSAAVLFALITTRYRIQIRETEHVAGVDNEECDKLSRRDGEGRMRRVEEVLGQGVEDLGLEGDKEIRELIGLCNPGRLCEQDEEFEDFWSRAVALVNSFAPGRRAL